MPLTRREREIAALASSGARNGQIARQLHLSVRTVETHLNRILRRQAFKGEHGKAWVETQAVHLREAGQAVQHERTRDRNVQAATSTEHRNHHDIIGQIEDLCW